MTEAEEVYQQGLPPLPPRYRFRDLIWGDHVLVDEDRKGRFPLFGKFFSEEEDDHERVRVEFFTNEKSLKQRLQLYFIKNQRSSLRIRIFNLFIKLLSCVLYVVRTALDNPKEWECQNCTPPDPLDTGTGTGTGTDDLTKAAAHQESTHEANWDAILWVERDTWLWGIQVTVAIISLGETLLLTYLGYKGNILQQILSWPFILEIVNTVPFIVTIFHAPLRDLFIPVFLNCWLAKVALESMLNDLHRAMQRSQSALAQQLLILTATLLCLVFTSMCGIQHLQRGGKRHFDLFDSLWFVIVTFSTVGYGDIFPDIWPSKLYMMCLIAAVFIVLPSQFEQLAYTWMERQKQGGSYSSHRAQNEKHVVVAATTLHADTIMDFLNEFYAHPKLQDFYVVLLSPSELDVTMKMLLQVPIWAARVIYIQGSALKDADLSRCRMQDAEACFMIASRNYSERTAADQHTILRSWAIKDFAPHCPQYVQIFRPENKFHVKFAEHVVCEDEFKYALLANNCLCPGASTLVTLLLHTSRGAEGQTSSEEWMRLYGKCSGNEIYHIRLGDSRFFGEYEGKSFTYASFHAHRKYGVALVGIRQDMHYSTIQLNPGPRHIMKATDLCFYMNITKEENSAFILAHPNQDKDGSTKQSNKMPTTGNYSKVASMIASVDGQSKAAGSVALEMQHREAKRTTSNPVSLPENSSGANLLELPKGVSIQALNRRPSIAPVPAMLEANGIDVRLECDSESESEPEPEPRSGSVSGPEWSNAEPDYVRGFPPLTPYIGTSPTLCYLRRDKRPLCCLQLSKTCEHCAYNTAKEYNWPNRAIIVAADYASNGLYNFIVPLRSHARPKNSLNPIVLLLERRPDESFLETICYFPMVYWMIGSIENLDDLLKAGINLVDNVVIVNKESSNSAEEDTLADCNTIVAVQTIFRLFPSANIITELSQASNMKFMQFRAKDHYALQLSKLEKKEKDRGSHLYYMFRMPFAAGNIFSASMLDTLLYQAFVKDYLITFVRLLLGIDQAVGSGHLSCMKITREDLWIRTYGRLYQKLCSTTCEIPIGIYRHQKQHGGDNTADGNMFERIGTIVRKLSFRGGRPPKKSSEDMHDHKHGLCRECKASGRHYKHSKSAGNKPGKPLFYVSLNMGSEEDIGGNNTAAAERQEISQLVKCRMSSLGLPLEDYNDDASDKRSTICYVIINPSFDVPLQMDDIIYLIRPSSLSPCPSPLVDERKRMKREEPTGAEKTRADTFSSQDNNNQTLHESPTTPTITVDSGENEDVFLLSTLAQAPQRQTSLP